MIAGNRQLLRRSTVHLTVPSGVANRNIAVRLTALLRAESSIAENVAAPGAHRFRRQRLPTPPVLTISLASHHHNLRRPARIALLSPVTLLVFYVLVVTLGILSMGFQLLASRLLNPHFGSSIIVWAWLISTFLAAFSVGSLLGGWISTTAPARRNRAQVAVAVLGAGSLAVTAFLGRPMLVYIEVAFADMNTGLLVACLGLFFLPVTMLSTFGPQCVHYLAARGTPPGPASGVVYGISTLGNIAGVMLTAFALIPHFRVSTLLYGWLAVAIVSLAGLIGLLRSAPGPAPS